MSKLENTAPLSKEVWEVANIVAEIQTNRAAEKPIAVLQEEPVKTGPAIAAGLGPYIRVE